MPAEVPDRRLWNAPIVPALVVAVGFTVAVVVVPDLRFAYDNFALHATLETAEGIGAIVLAALFAGRFGRTRDQLDLAVFAAFVLLATVNVVVSALPMVTLGERPSGFVTWFSLLLRAVAALGFAVAALGPDRRVTGTGRGRAAWAAAVLVVLVVLATSATARLGSPVDPALSPELSSRPLITGHAAVVGLLIAGFALYVASAAGLAARAAGRGDDLLQWLAAGAAVSAVSRLHYVLFPSLFSNWVYTGDLVRFGAYGLFVTGGIRALQSHWSAVAGAAVLDEQHRIARELHDGVIQEISFIRSQTTDCDRLDGPILDHVAQAADRALGESRLALDVLEGAEGGLADALRKTAEAVAGRAGAEVRVLAATGGVRLAPDARHTLLRVVREATTNAVRHGRASLVEVSVANGGDGIVVTIIDDGIGFDPAAVVGGFGLRSMRQRVESLGGTLAFGPGEHGGAALRAVIPPASG